jgi:hypothetical protein
VCAGRFRPPLGTRNEQVIEAAQGNPVAETAWKEYHAFIDTAEYLVQKKFGKGIYIDLDRKSVV